MTVFDRLNRWKDQTKITSEQHQVLAALVRREPFSVYLPLNGLLYVGVLAFVGGLGWTIQTYFHQLGDAAILLGLSGLLAACLAYCFMRGLPYFAGEARSPNFLFDYVLYLGCLSWSVELGYIENRFHVMAARWDIYLLMTALFFFAMAYRFDNRFVLSMALSTLAAWFGVKLSHFVVRDPSAYRLCAIAYGLVVMSIGAALQCVGIKKHFLGTYLNFAANVLFVAVLSGVFESGGSSLWTLFLLLAGAVSLVYGIRTRQFAFVAYAVVYGYLGVSSILLRDIHQVELTLGYLLVSGAGMIAFLTFVARRFGREA